MAFFFSSYIWKPFNGVIQTMNKPDLSIQMVCLWHSGRKYNNPSQYSLLVYVNNTCLRIMFIAQRTYWDKRLVLQLYKILTAHTPLALLEERCTSRITYIIADTHQWYHMVFPERENQDLSRWLNTINMNKMSSNCRY